MTNEEREKKTKIANMLIGTIKDLRTPMLMYQVEKDVAKEALENYIKALEQEPILDKIREQIELEKLGYPPSAGYYKAIMKVLQIIDEYKKDKEDNK